MAKKYSNNPIPDKHTDWGKDPTNHNYPFSGRSVQNYIKEQFETKVGYLHPDASNENYLLFADEENYNLYMADPVTHADLLIGTVPLASNYLVAIDLENTQTINYINYGETGNYIQAYFKVLNKTGAEISDEFKVTITIRNGSAISTIHRNATYGTLFSINVDEYLTEGTNIVTLSVASVTYGVGTSMSLTYHSILLRVSDTLDISNVYGNENETLEAAVHIEGTGTKKIEWFIDGVQLAFDSQTDETSQSSTTLTRYISLSNLAEGRHNLQYRGVININGINFYSDTQYRDIIVYRGVTLDSIIANAFSYRGVSIIDPTDDPIELGTVEQYMTKEIRYAIYDPNNLAVNAVDITVGDKTTTVNADNYNEYVYELKAFNYGSTGLSFEINNITLEYNVTVSQSTLDIATIGNTEFEFEGNCRINTSLDKRLEGWEFVSQSGNHYLATMVGFDYTERNGWTGEGLLIADGASLLFNCAPLNYNVVQNGGTFEFEFETRRVLNDDEVICNLMSNGLGIRITASEAKIVSQQGVELTCKYKAEERNRITFVVNPLNAAVNKGLIFIFINGILSGVKNYTVGDSFTNNTNISFVGSADANILIYQLRFYRRALRLDEVLNNYIIYRPTVDELLAVYDKNDIYTSGSLSLDKLSAQTPIIIITGNVQELQDFTKADKGTYRKMAKIEVINTDDPTKNLTLVDASMRCQGTSSMNYPKKNFRFYTQADSKDETVQSYVTKMYDYEGVEYTGNDRLYAFKEGAQPVKTWCLKADYAESSSTHNTGTARLWNNLFKNAVVNNVDQRYYRNTTTPLRTQAQQAALDNEYEYDVRTAIDGFPIVLFYHLNENDPLIFLGKYNWNNDKSTESVFGFKDVPGFNNEHMECWEVVNGDYPENLFTDLTNWDTDIQYEGKTMKGWQRAFESRYPDDSGKASEATRANGALKTFATWINGLKTAAKVQGGQVVVDDAAVMATFSAEKWQHMDVYKMAGYYVYLMRQGAVDQTVKNAMFTTEDGLHWYYILYDNDTINGLDNNGALAFGYTIDRQTIDPRTGNSYCYAGHDSVLWNNLEADADFMAIVKIVDQALYNVGLNYASAINMYNNEQSKKWSERLHNLDSQYKYLDPFLNDNNSVGLPKLQGSRDTHRQWWLSNRFALYDAINVTGAYKANVFLVRVSTVTLPSPVNAYVTPARTGQIYGYGKGGVPVVAGVSGTVDVPITMPISDELYVGASLDFYNAVFAKKIDISCIAEYLTEVHLEAINSAAFDSSLEELILGTSISGVNINALTQLTNLGQAKYLKKLGICNFNGLVSIDLSQNKYFEYLDAAGCANLTNIVFPDAAPITNLVLPANLKRFALKEITTNFVHNFADITPDTIDIRSCNITNINKTSPSLLFDWAERREQAGVQTECNVYIDSINWNNVDPEDIIAFAQYVKAHGYLTLKGVCRLSSCTLEQVTLLREEFGNNCFDADAYLRFVGQGVFFVGPEDVLSDGQYQYSLINATGVRITPTWTISGISGASVTQQGLVTIPEITGNDGSITLQVVYTLDGEIVNATKNVVVRKRVYPANATIQGDTKVETRNTYNWTTSTQGVNGEITSVWALSGDIANYASIVSQNTNSCIVELTNEVIGSVTGTLTLTIKKASNNSTLVTATKTLTAIDENIAFTDVTDPYLMVVMHNNYKSDGVTRLADNEHFMTKMECALVVKEDLYKNLTPNFSNSIFNTNDFRSHVQNMDALQYFTGLTEIPTECFYGGILTSIIIPKNVTKIGKSAIYPTNSSGISSLQFKGNSITLCQCAIKLHLVDDFIVNIPVNVEEDLNAGTQSLSNSAGFNIISTIPNKSITFNEPVTITGSDHAMLLYIKGQNKVIANIHDVTLVNQESYLLYVTDTPTNKHELNLYNINKNNSTYLFFSVSSKATCDVNLYCDYIPGISNNITYARNKVNCKIAVNDCSTQCRFDEESDTRLYLLNNTVVPQALPLSATYLTGKCIVVRHDMVTNFQNAFPTIADHFTDLFTAEGDPVDFTVTGDDVIGQAIGTILHVSNVYNGHYADGTSGQEVVVEDMEQEDNFFPQNETNDIIQRTFNVTINGITKSCTINQNIKDTRFIIKLKVSGNHNANTVLFGVSQYSGSYGTFYEGYRNGIKAQFSYSYGYLRSNHSLSDNDILLIKISLPNPYGNSPKYTNNYKEINLSNLEKPFMNYDTNTLPDYSSSLLEKLIINQIAQNTLYINNIGGINLTEIICLDADTISISGNNFGTLPQSGILKYPYNADYSALIAKLPSGWTTQKIYPPYLVFKSSNSFTLGINNSIKNWDGILEYSTDKETWTVWNGSNALIAVADNGTYYLYLRGSNNTYITGSDVTNKNFTITGNNVQCEGDIRMLLDYEDPENTTMANYCFAGLFYKTSGDGIITTPVLPATTLSTGCYKSMFYGNNITVASELPATILVASCYQSMLGETAITTAPELPALTLADSCYKNMLLGCTSLIKSPKIIATTLATDCYYQMFKNCSSLNEVSLSFDAAFDTAKATDWVNGVAASGTFAKNANLTIANGTSGIPSGWTIEDIDPPYLEFSSPNSFTLGIYNNNTKGWNGTVEYSTDLINWTIWTGTRINSASDGNKHKLYLRGENNTIISGYQKGFSIIGSDVECNGDIRVLLNYKDPKNTTMDTECFSTLFMNCTSLIKAPKLLSTTLSANCYYSMFSGCSNLVYAPTKLPAINDNTTCYQNMFQNCTSLTESPIIYTNFTRTNTASNMFRSCSSLTKITYLGDGAVNYNNSQNWVNGVGTNGMFYKKSTTSISIGTNGVPSGWSVVDVN